MMTSWVLRFVRAEGLSRYLPVDAVNGAPMLQSHQDPDQLDMLAWNVQRSQIATRFKRACRTRYTQSPCAMTPRQQPAAPHVQPANPG
jgi:hypothetical protein